MTGHRTQSREFGKWRWRLNTPIDDTTKQSHAQACLVAEPRLTALLQDVGAGKARRAAAGTKKRGFETPTTLASAGKNTCVKETLE